MPADPRWKPEDILLLRTFDKYYSSDESKTVILENGRLRIKGFNEEGYYILRLLPLDKTIDIITIKDGAWEGDSPELQRVYDEE
jgi:hypothetical protein